ncbi:hypothetical protein TREES_T100009729 [Tupaia chinensis]|uniref:Uncharacterized protein n=1 Tax=Tupaia chinensis TaxID=246437 RepID=L9KZF2_TUPCH|nr:hypothetical protein TREES_T100009729 [Tupaia chinensis]
MGKSRRGEKGEGERKREEEKRVKRKWEEEEEMRGKKKEGREPGRKACTFAIGNAEVTTVLLPPFLEGSTPSLLPTGSSAQALVSTGNNYLQGRVGRDHVTSLMLQ